MLKFAKRSFARANQGTLTRKQVPKERYMNRSEWMAHRYKNESESTYDWVPEIFTTLDPSPRYHDPAVR